jgi:hypothetical protein
VVDQEQGGHDERAQGQPSPGKSTIIRIFRALKRQRNRHYGQSRKGETEHQRNERTLAKWTRHVGIFTIVLAATAGITAIIFWRQLSVMQGQLDVMEAEQRPWVYIFSAEPRSDLYFNVSDKIGALVFLKFTLKNAGKKPARFAVIEGEFLMRDGTAADTRKGWGTCDKMRTKKAEEFLAGTAVFPDQVVEQSHRFVMSKEDVAKWSADFARADSEKSNLILAPMIVGCIDYVFERENVHHQTRFVFEIDKNSTGLNPFVAINPAAGNVPQREVAMAKNPGLADEPD